MSTQEAKKASATVEEPKATTSDTSWLPSTGDPALDCALDGLMPDGRAAVLAALSGQWPQTLVEKIRARLEPQFAGHFEEETVGYDRIHRTDLEGSEIADVTFWLMQSRYRLYPAS